MASIDRASSSLQAFYLSGAYLAKEIIAEVEYFFRQRKNLPGLERNTRSQIARKFFGYAYLTITTTLAHYILLKPILQIFSAPAIELTTFHSTK